MEKKPVSLVVVRLDKALIGISPSARSLATLKRACYGASVAFWEYKVKYAI